MEGSELGSVDTEWERIKGEASAAYAALVAAQRAHCASLDRVGIVRASFGPAAYSISHLHGRDYSEAARMLGAEVDARLAPLLVEVERLGKLRGQAREALAVARAAWVAAGMGRE